MEAMMLQAGTKGMIETGNNLIDWAGTETNGGIIEDSIIFRAVLDGLRVTQ
jgi:hypothetical protein